MPGKNRFFGLAIIVVLLFTILLARADSAPSILKQPSPAAAVHPAFNELPLYFVANRGQVDSRVLYYAATRGGTIYLTQDGIVCNTVRPGTSTASNRLVLRLNIEAKSGKSIVESGKPAAGIVNYLIGNNPSAWLTGIPTYAEIVYKEVYPAIDLRLYGKGGSFAYDFIVHPSGDVQDIRLSIDGAEGLDAAGSELVIHTALGDIKQQSLRIYQQIESRDNDISGSFAMLDCRHYGFRVADYDENRDLIIDPTLLFSTYVGGTSTDAANAVTFDGPGNTYITGTTNSTDFPATAGVLQPALRGPGDAFVTKINPAGTGLVYSTYLGGSGTDIGNGIAVDTQGNAYIAGSTDSTDFPTVAALQGTNAGATDAFVTKLNSNGTGFTYSTYLGGTGADAANAIALNNGIVFVTGTSASSGFPVSAGSVQPALAGATDAFVTSLNQAGGGPVYSTFLGGSGNDQGRGIDVNAEGDAFVTGTTDSTNFPVTVSAFQPTLEGISNGFVTRLNNLATMRQYSTYLGGSGTDVLTGIAVDAGDNAFITGYTSSPTYPVTPLAFQSTLDGIPTNAVITKLNPVGTALIYSTFLGGTGADQANSIALDLAGSAYVTGSTTSTDFPVTSAAFQPALKGATDSFISELNPGGTALAYSTFMGGDGNDAGSGIAVDNSGSIYFAGATFSINFPVTAGAYQIALGGPQDAIAGRFTTATAPVGPPSLNRLVTPLGAVQFRTNSGTLTGLRNVSPGDIRCNAPGYIFPYGMFAFQVINLAKGQTVQITITFPTPLPLGTKYYKCQDNALVDYSDFVTRQDEYTLILRITDGGKGDSDKIFGQITDPGGPGFPYNPIPQSSSPSMPSASQSQPLPNIYVQSAKLSASKILQGNPLTVTASVSNSGAVNGSTRLRLMVNGTEEASQSITLESGQTTPVTFTVKGKNAGTYNVSVGGVQAGTFTVTKPDLTPLWIIPGMVILLLALWRIAVIVRQRSRGD
jgi:hypothetical protein